MTTRTFSRRRFITTTSIAAGSIPLLSRLGYASPNEKLHTAHVGVGGKGRGHLEYCFNNETVVALCDVDDDRAAESYKKYPDIAKYKDFRVMLEKQKDIDAVIVATPDHIHAPAGMAAMRLGKHAFVEKPLTHSVYEARLLAQTARETKVATQMGNQGHAMSGVRELCEMIWDGVIGEIREVHTKTNRPVWPQGIPEPLPKQDSRDSMAWDLWLGPAPFREYAEGYAPFKWRGWWDFGCGALGDMGCHILDPAFWALHLGIPDSVESLYEKGNSDQTGPTECVLKYNFPRRMAGEKHFPATTMYWYDGDLQPSLPEDFPKDVSLGDTVFVGEKGYITCATYGQDPRLLPEKKFEGYKPPDPYIERIPDDNHRFEWVRACKGGKPAGSNFDYAAALTEMTLLGNVALRAGGKIEWDTANMRVTNNADANRFIHKEYRKGWEI